MATAERIQAIVAMLRDYINREYATSQKCEFDSETLWTVYSNAMRDATTRLFTAALDARIIGSRRVEVFDKRYECGRMYVRLCNDDRDRPRDEEPAPGAPETDSRDPAS